ncbi:MAG: DUF748 domain-containing protein [Deltaproteobacteria bacterium]|nr:MAG: DUF748 domain-containing protein [Deltaproteobacteria bacterium]
MKRWVIVVSAIILVLVGASVLGFRIAVQTLKDRVVAALGPGSEVAELKVDWSSVELVGLNIQGPKGWPTARTLHAERVKIVPSLRSLLTDQIHISSITVEKPYLSALRLPGKLLMVPSLLETGARKDKDKRSNEEPSTRTVMISKMALEDGVMEIFDATVSKPPLKIRLEQIEAVVRDVMAPPLKGRTQFDLAAIVKGHRRDGRVKISGWVAAASRDSSSHIVLDTADLVSLQPYLIKKGEARVDKGTLDLNLKSEVRNNKLDGNGRMIIKELEFARSRSYLDTFMGLPRSTVISFLKDHDGAIDVDFALKGAGFFSQRDARYPRRGRYGGAVGREHQGGGPRG